ncbi:MAG: efflux RND transporter permease subunit [Phycisphaeraceae bacterium]
MTDHHQPTERSLVDPVIRFFLEQKLVVVLLTLLIVGWGVAVAPFDWDIALLPRDPVPVDAIPNLGENQQIVYTEWPGRSPQDVEDQLTYPLTVNLMGLPGVREVRSTSMFGASMIFLIFDEDTEFYWSRSRILEKLNALSADTLPAGVSPALGPDATGLGQIFWYTLEGRDPDGEPVGGWDLGELRAAQDWLVRFGLLAAEGVSEVASIGGHVPEYVVEADPDALRAYDVTLSRLLAAVRDANLDVGAGVTEINGVEYVIRGVGFVKSITDIERAVVDARPGHVPVRVGDVAHVTRGPAPRRGALTVGGAEAVGGVAVVREGYNPLQAIHNVKAQIAELAPGLPAKVAIDWQRVDRATVDAYAADAGLAPFPTGGEGGRNATSDPDGAWLEHLRSTPRGDWPEWATISQLTIVPFYDRTDLIHRTLGTLNDALAQQILVTIIVVLVLVVHLRSALVISAMLPLAVLMSFIMMKLAGVDANVVALAGIAIAIGTIVDMGVIVTENVLKHLRDAPPDEPRIEVVYRGTREVGSAILTAISTTIVSFLPVFTMSGAEGRMFIPLAYTKTFVLVGAIFAALVIVPAAIHLVIAARSPGRAIRRALLAGLGVAAIAVTIAALMLGWSWVWPMGLLLLAAVIYQLIADAMPQRVADRMHRAGAMLASAVAGVTVAIILAIVWEPLGPERGLIRNLIFVVGLLGGLLAGFWLFMLVYPHLLRVCLVLKGTFLILPAALIAFGLSVWLGFEAVAPVALPAMACFVLLAAAWDVYPMFRAADTPRAAAAAIVGIPLALLLVAVTGLALLAARYDDALRVSRPWVELSHNLPGLGREFMPPFDEGTFLWMPSTMPHASMGEALDVLRYQDMAIAGVPEVEGVFGKIGRTDSALDPAPISMLESVVNYKSEYVTDDAGRRVEFVYDADRGEYLRDDAGELIVADEGGRPFRQWREHIQSPRDIWNEIAAAAALPGTTGASPLQPIETRQVMLQTGMRAPMGIKLRAPDLDTLDRMALELERVVREVPAVDPATVSAERVVGKPYLEIHPDREAIARFGLRVADVHETLQTAVGGMIATTTVEGRERYGVRVRYPRELRQDIDDLERVIVAAPDGTHIPLGQLAEIRYERGPQMIRAEDTFLTAYVTFSPARSQAPLAEVDVVEQVRAHLDSQVAAGRLSVPPGVSWRFAGNYEHQASAVATLRIVIPIALAIIFLILYFQFRSVITTLIVFSSIAVAWAGGFAMLYPYASEGFANFTVFGVNMRELFNLRPINLSVAVWVGFLALFGIAVDNGVIIATYLNQSFARTPPTSIAEVRQLTLDAGVRRIRPCLMTTATTILALLPVLTATGAGADIMIPMAIPSVGGMFFVLLTMFSVPVLYCLVQELKLASRAPR